MVTSPMTLSDPYPPQTISFSTFCTAFHIFAMCAPKDFKFGIQVV